MRHHLHTQPTTERLCIYFCAREYHLRQIVAIHKKLRIQPQPWTILHPKNTSTKAQSNPTLRFPQDPHCDRFITSAMPKESISSILEAA